MTFLSFLKITKGVSFAILEIPSKTNPKLTPLVAWGKVNDIDLSSMSTSQAERFLQAIQHSDNPTISSFVEKINNYTTEIRMKFSGAGLRLFRGFAAVGLVDIGYSLLSPNATAGQLLMPKE